MTLAFDERNEPEPDAEVLQRMRDGDYGAYVVLYERYVGGAVRLAQSILRRGDVDDIVAEVFAAAFAAIRRGKGPADDFGPYVLSAVRRECYRASRRRRRRGESPAEPDAVARAEAGDIDELGNATERAVLSQAFDALPARMRVVLWLTEVEGLSHAQVATRMTSSPQAVAALAMRSRRALAEHYLHAHLGDTAGRGPIPQECREARQALAQIVRSTASPRQERRVSAHLAECAGCAHARDQLRLVNQRLRTLPPPAVFGTIGLSQMVGLGLRARLATLLLGPVAPLTAATSLFVGATTLPSAVPAAFAASPVIAAPGDAVGSEPPNAQAEGVVRSASPPLDDDPTAATTGRAELALTTQEATTASMATTASSATSTPSTPLAANASPPSSPPAAVAGTPTTPTTRPSLAAPPDVAAPVAITTRPDGASVSVAVPLPFDVAPLPDVGVAVSATLPPVTLPAVTPPPVTLPPVTLPPVTLPPVTLPPVTPPPVTLPPVELPAPVPPVEEVLPPIGAAPVSLETGDDGVAVGGGVGPVEAEASVTPDDVEVSVEGVDELLPPPAVGDLLPGP